MGGEQDLVARLRDAQSHSLALASLDDEDLRPVSVDICGVGQRFRDPIEGVHSVFQHDADCLRRRAVRPSLAVDLIRESVVSRRLIDPDFCCIWRQRCRDTERCTHAVQGSEVQLHAGMADRDRNLRLVFRKIGTNADCVGQPQQPWRMAVL
eukprot:1159356-Rhodomonas_salina.2